MNDIESFVEDAYKKILGRESDQEGKNHYVKEIREGRLTNQQLIDIFRNSDEYKEKIKEKISINNIDQDRSAGMERFISIIVPYFNRPHYLRELIDSVHKFADIPFELIVHDDASVDGSTPDIFNMRDKISTLIINSGHNLGIAISTNRLVNMASSEYIIFLNDDCAFVSKCLNNVCEILSRPYIGYLSLIEPRSPELNMTEPKFVLGGIKNGSVIAFRKSVWKEIGGWPEYVFSGASDVTFMASILKKGYFGSTPYGKEYVINMSVARFKSSDTSMCMSGYDCSYPKIFNLREDSYDSYCKRRERECNRITNSFNNIPEGLTNLDYWTEYMTKLLSSKQGDTPSEKIDWEIAKRHGQDKWKDIITSDNALTT